MTLSLRTLTLLFVAMSLTFTGCGSMKKKKKSETNEYVGDARDAADLTLELNGDSDSGKAGGLKTVYFAFNSARLSSNTRKALAANAAYMKAQPDVQVQIEGHCDERGGVQYNLALGERRAVATRDYLVSMGVSSSRISTTTYGKERPVAFGHDEESWAKNRRSNFVVTAK